MLEELAVSILHSAVYDCLKFGIERISKELFDKTVLSKKGSENISTDEMNTLYKVANELLSELQAQQRNYFTKEEFLKFTRNYLSSNDEIFRKQAYTIALQKADNYYNDSNYDQCH